MAQLVESEWRRTLAHMYVLHVARIQNRHRPYTHNTYETMTRLKCVMEMRGLSLSLSQSGTIFLFRH